MALSIFDFIKLKSVMHEREFNSWEDLFFNKRKLEFKNRGSGRVTGELKPDKINRSETKVTYNIGTLSRSFIDFECLDVEQLTTNTNEFQLGLRFCPVKAIKNKNQNDEIVSYSELLKLIERVETYYCLNASDLKFIAPELSFNFIADSKIKEKFFEGGRFLIFKDAPLKKINNDATGELMGYKAIKGHFTFKFYCVDEKYGTSNNHFRMERQYTRTQTFSRKSGIKTLEDVKDPGKMVKCIDILVSDLDDLIIYDPHIVIPKERKVGIIEKRILDQAHDPSFWLKTKETRDDATFNTYLKKYRNLSKEFGDDLHGKIKSMLLNERREFEDLADERKKTSAFVTCS
ncbi:hypothetical protein [Flavihumibacter profundi]|uniref:hypothetical protein n=1 Tax=Flavihumibacter profundi TaxID=2716883 RepID=UPI001CC6F0F4|nr:hypothetical protein [Flavihumibacter profundi]MBZ5859450.1 hypothetical protein [Flavihumibacter profundi]